MRYAVFSDIHANLEGLQAVLDKCAQLGVDSLVCCGDIIGYNADPNACVELMREKGVRCIQGNHERGLRDLEEGRIPNMNPVALEALAFTRETITADNRDWLFSLPDQAEVGGFFRIFHGSPSDPDEYIFDPFEAAYAFKALVNDYPPPGNLLCFIGHTHVCAAYAFDPENHRVVERKARDGDLFAVKPGAHYMFNAGSCGQYRGVIPAATFCLLDGDEMTVEFHFLQYDLRGCQEKILAAGLPPVLAQRLSLGQ